MFGKACSKCIDENIAVIALVEVHFTANGRNAESIAVAANAGNNAGNKMAGLWMIRFAKAQRVHCCHRASTHCEHVT